MNPLKHILPASIGNMLDIYEFAIYGYFAQIIGQQFFPSDRPINSLLYAFIAFAAGFIMRPIGGYLFGWLGDTWGRKQALILSVFTMTFPTLGISLLPTYAHIGLAAPICMTLFRLIQGLSTGGEFTGAVTYIAEQAPLQQRGFYASFAVMSAFLGFFCASLISMTLRALLTEEALVTWGWRIPFFLSFLLGLVGYYLRKTAQESPVFLQRQPLPQKAKLPWRPIGWIMGLNVVCSISYYISYVYLFNYLSTITDYPKTTLLLINTVNIACLAILALFFGYLSDSWSRIRVIGCSIVALMLFSLLILPSLPQQSLLGIFGIQFGLSCCIAGCFGPMPAFLTEITEVHFRYRCIGIGWNIAAALFGGTTPAVILALSGWSPNTFWAGYYLAMAAGISLFTLWHIDLSGCPQRTVSPLACKSA